MDKSEIVPRSDTPTPALLDQAEQALAAVTSHEEAEDIWRKIAAIEQAARFARIHGDLQLKAGRLKLRAERRWGELLGPAENTGLPVSGANGLSGRDRVARHQAREVAAVDHELFNTFLRRTQDPERLRRARLFRLQREKEAAERAANTHFPPVEGVDLRLGDLRTTLDDLTGSVDGIVTDPPYGAQWIDEYDALGELAARLLRPGGILVVMSGSMFLPALLERLGRHLRYRWCGAYLMPGPAARIHARQLGSKWKPILIYGGDRFLIQDVFSSEAGDKQHHAWGQSESGMADIVARTTLAGELVVDPFLGAGTTAVVCRDLGRRFVGCDVDPVAIAHAQARING